MRKSTWISLVIAFAIAGLLALLEQRRGHYFIDPSPLPDRQAGLLPLVASATGGEGGRITILDYKLAFLMQRGELSSYDARFKFRGDQKPNPDIAIIAIDEPSLARLHQW